MSIKISTLVCVHSRNYQQDAGLEYCIESILDGSRKPDEIIVVLDECWYGTEIMLGRYKKQLKILKKPKKEGLAMAKNFGLRHCSGDWVTYCDADDWWFPSKLEIQYDFVRDHDNPKVDFLFTESWDQDEDLVIRPNCFYGGQYQTNEDIRTALPHENVLCHGSAMIRMDALRALDKYNTDSKCLGMEDWELWVRAANAGYRFYKIPERLYVWSIGTSVER